MDHIYLLYKISKTFNLIFEALSPQLGILCADFHSEVTLGFFIAN